MQGGARLLAMTGVLALVLAACGDGDDATGTSTPTDDASAGTLKVVSTTTIIGALAQEVGGELVEVDSIIQPGIDPHTFEPSPDDAATVAEADIVLMNGIELDDYLIEFIESANSDVPLLVVTDGIELLGFEEGGEHKSEAGEHEDEHADEHENGEFDPHVWQDPMRVKQMVDNIAGALADADSANAAEYQTNTDAYTQRLDEVDAEIRAMLDPIPEENRNVVTNHEALAYFAERYDLHIVGTVIPGSSSDVEPSAQEIAELIEVIEHEGVSAILAERLIDPKVAEQIANDTGVVFVTGIYTDSVGEPGSGAETVDGMLLANATQISEALSR